MGLLGLRKFIDTSGCTRLLRVPLSEGEEAEEEERMRQAESSHAPARGCKRPRASLDDAGSDGEDGEHGDAISSPLPGGAADAVPEADHVLIDANCIVHACFGRRESEGKSKREIIRDVLERIQALVTRVVVPRRSLTICLDGPAPAAKLQTQRLRRRKVSLMDAAGTDALTSLAVTAGSLFLVELENAIGAQFKLNGGRGFLRHQCPVFLYGSTVPGEGEAKISRALTYISSSPNNTDFSSAHGGGRGRHAPQQAQRPTPLGPYRFNDTVCVFGNDIDLVVTCLGATHYHNLSVVSPASLQLISVADILYRWMRAAGASRGETSRLLPPQLPSLRVDFIFLFLLNGGDHYTGAGEVALPLWRRYQSVRAAYPHSTLVSSDLRSVDVAFLADVLQASEYTGDADPAVGVELLEAALWSLYTTVTGVCPDYSYVPRENSPHLSHLRAAAAACVKKRETRVHLRARGAALPLTPLEAYVALMPSESALPASVAQALRLPANRDTARTLAGSADPKAVAAAARAAVAAAAPFLTTSERYLCQFSPPVQLNVPPPRQRLTRHEHHRRLALAQRSAAAAGGGTNSVRAAAAAAAAAAESAASAVPTVQRLEPVSEREVPYVRGVYPRDAAFLAFRCPFDAPVGDSSGTAAPAPRTAAAAPAPAARSTPVMPGTTQDLSDASDDDGATAAAGSAAAASAAARQRSAGGGRRLPERRVYFTPQQDATAAVPTLEEAAEKEISTRRRYAARHSGALSERQQRVLARRLRRVQTEGNRQLLAAADREITKAERSRARGAEASGTAGAPAGDDGDFYSELQDFLGDDAEAMQGVLSAAERAAARKAKRQRERESTKTAGGPAGAKARQNVHRSATVGAKETPQKKKKKTLKSKARH